MVVHLIRRVKRKRTEIAAVMTDWSLPNVEIEVRVKKRARRISAPLCPKGTSLLNDKLNSLRMGVQTIGRVYGDRIGSRKSSGLKCFYGSARFC